MLLVYLLGAFIAFALPGQFSTHYYQLFLPPLCLGVGCTIPLLLQRRPTADRTAVILHSAFAAFSLFLLARRAVIPFRLTPTQVSILKYQSEFVAADLVAHQVNRILNPGEIYFDASTNPEIYFTSKRPLQCGIFYTVASINGPRAEQFADRVLADLAARPPELVTLENADRNQSAPEGMDSCAL